MSQTPTILSAQEVTKRFSSQPVLQDISLSLHAGERIGLIGRNGSGKSTLLKILAGLEQPDSGEVTRMQGLRVKLLQQTCSIPGEMTVGAVLAQAGEELRVLLAEHDALGERLARPDLPDSDRTALQGRFDSLQHTLELRHAWDYPTEIKKVREALDLPEDDRTAGTLSGGELRRVDLAATLLSRPDALLLDEPTNHIDTKSAEWIEGFLARYDGSCILVTHDRYFLEMVVNRIVEIEFNRLYSFPGNYERFLEYKAQIKEVEAKSETSRQGVLRRELAWLQRGPKARATKQKARIKRYEDLEAQGPPKQHGETTFQIPAPPRLGKRILEVESLGFRYGDRAIIDDLTFILQKGMRVGVMGPNGSGKTTLLNLLMGTIDNFKGKIVRGDTTEFLYVDQLHADINPDEAVLDFVTGGGNFVEVNDSRVFVPSYLESMLFDRDTVRAPMRNLSGGERNRVILAKKLLRGGNVLVLDEPTNDLDLNTLRVVEEAIEDFDGCAILVSHDRYFLNRLATHMIAFDGEGQVVFLVGNYDDYVRFKEEQDEAAKQSEVRVTARVKSKRSAPEGRLTYKEREELGNIEGVIEEAEASVRNLEERIQAPGFYEGSHEDTGPVVAALAEAKATVEKLYARWSDLDARKDIK